MHTTFHTPGPVSLTLQIGAGEVTLAASDTTETTVNIEGTEADSVVVEQRGDEILVVERGLRTTLFGGRRDLEVNVVLPAGSHLAATVAAARLTATGRYGAARIKSGSGAIRVSELTGDSVIEAGSGGLEIEFAGGALQVRSGSGDVIIGTAVGAVVITSGSGAVRVGTAESNAAIRSGSGNLHVGDAYGDLGVTTASGDITVEQIRQGVAKANSASGDVSIGVPPGIPVWTDVRSISGDIRSDLEGAGRPAAGQPYIEIHATTVSGDVNLSQRAPEGV